VAGATAFLRDLSRLIDGEEARFAARECGDFASQRINARDVGEGG
jgi:hypothetical protein